jgi:hypothetical protein
MADPYALFSHQKGVCIWYLTIVQKSSIFNREVTNMEKTVLMNEIKLIELKLNLLKAKITGDEAKTKTSTAVDLYGILKNSDDITPEDIDAIKVRMKEYAE